MSMGTKVHKKPPLMERAGIWYLKKLNSRKPPERIDIQTHILDKEEREKINRIVRQAVFNVSLAGALSSVASGLAAFFADSLNDDQAGIFSETNLIFWAIVLGVTIFASLLEIIYIYYDIMAKAFALTSAAHMELFPDNEDEELIAAPIVRAALELPNKKEQDLNIDPRKESSKIIILIGTIFYKLKISVTNFILKALVKRMLGRAISRAWLNFLSVPVCAFWNGMVCWLAIREVKIRVLGPSAVHEIMGQTLPLLKTMSQTARLSILRAIGSSIVRTANLHPNLEYLFRSFLKNIDVPKEAIIDEPILFLEDLEKIPDVEKEIVLRILVFSSIIDGKVTYSEKKLLKAAFELCKIPLHYQTINNLRKSFRRGELLNFSFSLAKK